MSRTGNYSGSISVGTALISRTVPGELRQQMKEENFGIPSSTTNTTTTITTAITTVKARLLKRW